MKRVFHGALLLSLCVRMAVSAGPDEWYVQIYGLIQKGDTAQTSGDTGAAQESYRHAAVELQKLKTAHPSWNDQLVSFRLNYLREQIAAEPAATRLSPKPRVDENTAVDLHDVVEDGQFNAAAELKADVAELQGTVSRLTDHNRLLQAKLQEALSARPAAIDPLELAKAHEQIKQLEKDRDILRVEAAQRTNGVIQTKLDQASSKLQEALDRLSQQNAVIVKLSQEKTQLSEDLRVARDERLKAAQEENDRLQREIAGLRDQVSGHEALQEQISELRAQAEKNLVLEEQLQELRNRLASRSSTDAGAAGKLEEQLRERDLAITAFRAALKRLQRENTALAAKSGAVVSTAVDEPLQADSNNGDAQLREQFALLRSQSQTAAETVAKLEAELMAAESESTTNRMMLSAMQSQLDRQDRERALLEEQKRLAEAELGKMVSEGRAEAQEIGELKQQIASLQDVDFKLKAQTAALRDALDQNAALASNVAQLQELLNSARKDGAGLQSLSSQIEQMEASLDGAKQRAENLEQQTAQEKRRNETLSQDIRSLEVAKQKAEEEKASLEDAVKDLQSQLATASARSQVSTAELAKLKKLNQDKEILQLRVEALARDLAEANALREENEVLREQTRKLEADADDYKARLALANEASAAQEKLQQAQAQIEDLRLTVRDTVEDKRKAEAELAAAVDEAASLQSEVRDFEKAKVESGALRELLAQLERELAAAKDDERAEQEIGRLDSQLKELRAQLSALNAQAVPYTDEELDLLEKPKLTGGAQSSETSPKKRAGKESLPPGAGALNAAAERAFGAGQYEEAASNYRRILELDEDNVFALGNLAAAQIEQNQLDQAEETLAKSLKADPDDPYSLSLLGILRFRQSRFDEAFTRLSRSAELDSQNPETQNYLGIVLSQRGQRAAAETALRKAVQLAPGYAAAHHNLAVVYATQDPPFIELARFHYDRAVGLGHPRRPDLESIIEGEAGTGSARQTSPE